MDTDQQIPEHGGSRCGDDGVIRTAEQQSLYDAAIAEAQIANDAFAASLVESDELPPDEAV